jgi:ADP-ribosylglycohydrolase
VQPLGAFVAVVAATSELTHNTGLGIAAAAAVGAAVSAGVDGATTAEALEVAAAAAEEGAQHGNPVAGGDIAARLRWSIPYLRGLPEDARDDAIAEVIGTSVAAQESVVAALALTATADDPWEALCRAAGLGGDTDTIAAMAGAVLGATGAHWPKDALATVRAVNELEFGPLVSGLLRLREQNGLRERNGQG